MTAKYYIITFIYGLIYSYTILIKTKNINDIFTANKKTDKQEIKDMLKACENIGNHKNQFNINSPSYNEKENNNNQTLHNLIIPYIEEKEKHKNTYFILAEFELNEGNNEYILKKNNDDNLENFDLKIKINNDGSYTKEFKYNNEKIKESENNEKSDEGHLFEITYENLYNTDESEKNIIYATCLNYDYGKYGPEEDYIYSGINPIFKDNTRILNFKSIYCFGHMTMNNELFAGCKNLEYVKLNNCNKNSIRDVEEKITKGEQQNMNIFDECKNLHEIDFSSYISKYDFIQFPKCTYTLILNNDTEIFKLNYRRFTNNKSLKNLAFSNKKKPMRTFMDHFHNCENLTYIDGCILLDSNSENCFTNCKKLKKLNIKLDGDFHPTKSNFENTNIETLNIDTAENLNFIYLDHFFNDLKTNVKKIKYKNYELEIQKDTNIKDFMTKPNEYATQHPNNCHKISTKDDIKDTKIGNDNKNTKIKNTSKGGCCSCCKCCNCCCGE